MKYIIGDIHANVTQLEKLLKLIRPAPADLLIFLGDYIDKNPHTHQTIALLEELDSNYDCVFIKGDHEYVWERYLSYRELSRQEFLLNFGGLATLSQLCPNPAELIKDNRVDQIKKLLKPYLDFLPRLVDYFVVDQYLALHAGITTHQLAEKPLKFTELNYFLRPVKIDQTKKYLGRYRLVAGHTHLSGRPVTKPGYINIDLGAGYQGFLGAFCVENHQVFRSDGKVYKMATTRSFSVV
ncbi:MAG: metallophosphoesterase [Candidatus Chisholmbacteria bacterium]|nr:metallophosphoesterase [Candidatus Chisholmbacteria bacterium]